MTVTWKRGARPNDDTFAEIVRRITAVSSPRKIILFGSAATGTMTDDSDIDLLVIFDTVPDRLGMMTFLRGQLNVGFPLDILVMETRRFEDTKEVIGGMAYPAYRFGRSLYDSRE